MPVSHLGCHQCGESVDVFVVAPKVTPGGILALCPTCVAGPAATLSSVASVAPEPSRNLRTWAIAACLCTVVGASATVHATVGSDRAPPAQPAGVATADESAVTAAALAVAAETPVAHGPEPVAREPYQLSKKAAELAANYPALDGWIHPVAGTDDIAPDRRSRQFGASRGHGAPPECGAGHCGVDLGGPRGRAIVAVQKGRVARLVFAKQGNDGISGRYVRLEHDGGVFTSYMHMDRVGVDLREGLEVEAGHVLGTLGATGVVNSAPHLHFSVEVTTQRGGLRYIDPAEYLKAATVAPVPDRPRRNDAQF